MESLPRLLNACHLLQGKIIALIGDNSPDAADIGAVGELINQCRQLFDEYSAEVDRHVCAVDSAISSDPNRTALISDDEEPDTDPNRTAIITPDELAASGILSAVHEEEAPVEACSSLPAEQETISEIVAVADDEDAHESAADSEEDCVSTYMQIGNEDSASDEVAEVAIAEETDDNADAQYISLDDLSELDSEENGVIRVDELLQRRVADDIRKAFTLNDKYRFRRELFGNSDIAFNDALDMIASMHSFEEAHDYFSNDLGWNLDNDDVKDFLEVVSSHFK